MCKFLNSSPLIRLPTLIDDFLSFFTWICHETRPFYTGAQELNIEISKLQAKIQELGGPEEAPQESLEVRVGKLYSQLFFKVCVTEPREKASINH